MDILIQDKILHIGDSIHSDIFYEFHLKPARIHFRARKEVDMLENVHTYASGISLGDRKCIYLRPETKFDFAEAIKADVILVSGNAPVPPSLKNLRTKIVVLDATNSLWKIEQWKKACEELLLRCHSVTQEGTFVYSW